MRQYRDRLINLNLVLLAIIASAVIIAVAWQVLQVLFPVLILFLLALLTAFLLSSFVTRLEAANFPRGLAVVIVYLFVLALIFGLGALLVPLGQQIGSLGANLPEDVKQLRRLLKRSDAFFVSHHIPMHLSSFQHQGLTYFQGLSSKILGGTLEVVLNLSQVVIDIIAIIVISLYLLIDGPRLRHNILRLIPDPHRSRVLFVDAALRTVVGSYVRGQLLLALTIGLMAAAGTGLIVHVRYPLVIGLLAGFFELIPMLGPILGAVPAITIAAFQGWQVAVATLVLFIVIQQLEAHVIAPRIMGHAVGVHPIIAILAVLTGAKLNGVFGALVSVPLAGIVYVMGQAVYGQLSGQQQVVTVVRRPPRYLRWFRHVRGQATAADTPAPDEGTIEVTVEAPSDQVAEIVRDRDLLAEQFETVEKEAHDEHEGDGDEASGAIPVVSTAKPEGT